MSHNHPTSRKRTRIPVSSKPECNCRMKYKMKTTLTTLAAIMLIASTAMLQSDRQERVQACAEEAGEGAIYLKEFVVSLPKAEKDQPPPVFRQSVILRGNNIYRFNLCNDKGQAIIRLYDSSTQLLTSYDTKTNKEYNPINFLCRKTGQYLVVISVKDGKAGEAVGIISHVMK